MDEEFFAQRRTNYVFVFLLTVSIFLLIAHLSSYVRGLKNFLFYILAPAPASATRFIQSGQKIYKTFGEMVAAHQENIELHKTLERYSALDIECLRMKEENERLRKLVNFFMPASRKSVAAQVVAREPASWFQWIVINRGSQDGIKADAPVLTWINDSPAVLGRVGEVSGHWAKVVLITNVLSALPATTRPSAGDGLIEGLNGHELKLSYLSPDEKISIGDEIVTSSLSAIFPPGVLIGKIRNIDSLPDNLSAYITPAVNFNMLREVVVVLPE